MVRAVSLVRPTSIFVMISTPGAGAAITEAIDGAASVVVAASGELHPARGPFVEALRHGVSPAQLHPETGRVQRLSKKREGWLFQ